MFSVLQRKSPHATICFLSSKMRAQKNQTVYYLDREAPDWDALIQFAIIRGRKLRQLRRMNQWDIQAELSATKLQKKETRDRKKVEKLLKTTSMEEVSDIIYITSNQQNKTTRQIFCKATSLDEHLPRMDERRRKSGIQREE